MQTKKKIIKYLKVKKSKMSKHFEIYFYGNKIIKN